MNHIEKLKEQFAIEENEFTNVMQMHDEVFKKLETDPASIDINEYFPKKLTNISQKSIDNISQQEIESQHVEFVDNNDGSKLKN